MMRPLYRIHRKEEKNAPQKVKVDFHALFDATPDPCLVLDRGLRIIEVNQAYLTATMTKRSEILGRDMFDVFPDNPEEDGATGVRNLRASLTRVLKDRVPDVMEVQKYDIRVPKELGGGFTIRYWSPINAPLLGPDGEVLYLLHRVQDVTSAVNKAQAGISGDETVEQLRLRFLGMDAEIIARSHEVGDLNIELKGKNEELSRQHEERELVLLQLDAVLEGIRDGVIISDLDGNVLRMNRSALALHESATMEQIQRPMVAFVERFRLSTLDNLPVAPDEWPLARVLRGDEFNDLEVQVESLTTGKKWIGSYTGTIVVDGGKCPILAVLTVRDITERQRIEEELRTAQEQLQLVTDTMPVGVLRCTRDRRCTWVSAEYARWMDRAVEDLAGEKLADIVGEMAYATVSPYVERVLAGKEVSYESVVEYAGSGARWVSARYVPTWDGSGNVDGWVAVVFDISQRKELEEEVKRLNESLARRVAELEEANQELDGFNRMVSHDLRQPLNTISTSCQAVKMLCGERLGEKCQEYIDVAYHKVFAMNDLINSLLSFSRSGQAPLERERVNLTEVVENIAADLRLTDPGRQVQFRVEKKLYAHGDAKLVRSALENLVGNAWKYTEEREDAVVEFGAREIAGERTYFVRDNGKGFDMAHAEDLFTPFKRLPDSDGYRGFGIGLATVDRIVRRHGGRIWAEGALGQGATFYFTLPPAAEKKGPASPSAEKSGERRSPGR